MATVINTPRADTTDSAAGLGLVVAVIVAVVLAALFLLYGVPALRTAPAATQPTTNSQSTNPIPQTNTNGSNNGSGGSGSVDIQGSYNP